MHPDPRRHRLHQGTADREILARSTQHDDHRRPRGGAAHDARPACSGAVFEMSSALPGLQKTIIDGLTVSWREAGQGEPLVLVHGIGGHSGSWQHQLASFARDHRVIAWDAPGYGGSDTLPAARLTADGYAAFLAALLRKLDVHRPHLVGHSLGSIVIAT